MGGRGTYDRGLTQTARRKDQRRALLAAAATVFSKVGYAGANVEAVVKAAHMSRRTFYEHFDDLEDILAAVHEASGRFAVRYVEEELARHPAPAERLAHGVTSLLELVANNPGLSRVLFWEIRAAGPRFEARQQRLRLQFAAMLSGVLEDCHAAGDVARRPDDVCVLALVAGIEAVGARLAAADGPQLQHAAAAMIRLARGSCA